MSFKKQSKKISIKNKISGLSYAFTDSGAELPVLDITHPLFIASVDDADIDLLIRNSPHQAQRIKEMPDYVKRFLGKRSVIMGGIYLKDSKDLYLNGMSTLMSKMGPYLIGGGWKTFFDRNFSMSLSPLSMRMRLRDTCRLQKDALLPQLKANLQKKLCFVNIAGGTANDSINTLILILKEDPTLLKNRKTEITILDSDTFGPNYARRCIKSLREPEGKFNGLEIACHHIKYNWNNTNKLSQLLSEKQDCIVLASSEGGLFEYGSDEAIISNLNALYEKSQADIKIAGDVILDSTTVNPIMPAVMESAGMSFRFLGSEGLKILLKETNWKTDMLLGSKPNIFLNFILKK